MGKRVRCCCILKPIVLHACKIRSRCSGKFFLYLRSPHLIELHKGVIFAKGGFIFGHLLLPSSLSTLRYWILQAALSAGRARVELWSPDLFCVYLSDPAILHPSTYALTNSLSYRQDAEYQAICPLELGILRTRRPKRVDGLPRERTVRRREPTTPS